MTASELMTENPATLSPQSTLAEAWDLMRDLDVRHVPVVERDAVVGMLSDRDLAALDVDRLLAEHGADGLRRRLARPVAEVMSSDVIVAEAETDAAELIALFLEYKVGAIPVVLPDSRQLIGIVSYIDVLRAVQNVLAGDE